MGRKQNPIPDNIRAQLLALGIPAAKHNSEVLSGMFPSHLNVNASGLNTADIARVLVHLAGMGLVCCTGRTDRASMRKIGPGWHCCQYYQDYPQLLDLVAPYIAQGLKNGEACLWVVADTLPIESTYQAIGKHVGSVVPYLHSGQLEVLQHPDWYLNSSGRMKSFEEIAAALITKQDLALSRGFKFLRASGDAGWIEGPEQNKEFVEYERKVNAVIGSTKIAAMCTYRAAVTADDFVAIVGAHQDALNKLPD